MSNIPRLLPLVGVAIVGVLAVNALSGAKALPQFLSAARAMAETAAPPSKGVKDKKGGSTSGEVATAGPKAPAMPAIGLTTPAAAAPVCSPSATDLAKSAGLSPAELQVLQSLGTRRGQIDQREKDLDVQTQLLLAAEAKLDAKLKTMAELKAQIELLMGQADAKTQAEVDHLTIVYSKMKPVDAAPLMATLDDKVRIPLAAQLEMTKPALLAQILSKMAASDAKHLTELLARRFAPVQQLAQAAAAPPAPDAKATNVKAPPAKTPPAKVDTAKADAAPDAAADAKAEPATPKAKRPAPRKIAKAKHKPKPKAKPVEEAKADGSTGPQPYASIKKADDPKLTAPSPAADKKAASPTR